jgi:hypothetical protein
MKLVAHVVLASSLSAALAAQTQPVPQPFPRPAPSQPARPAQPPPTESAKPPAAAAPSAAKPAAPSDPTDATLGVPIYPGAQFLTYYDAGRGQKFYIFGSATPYADLVAYYRTVLKQRGDLIIDVPATHMFEIGRFREDTMAFPPSVTIKEYKSDISPGFPNPKPGGQPARFPALIQIVPATEQR